MGLSKPDGTRIGIGDPLTVSGSLSGVPGDTACVSIHTLDATTVK